nr:hypothetical protein GCM10020092_084170 [Actinoplanes digitatis]
MLADQLGAPGEFAQPYVLAHEYGHHVQDLLGTEAEMRRAQQRDPGNANALSVKLELQADCYAGAWAKNATGTDDKSGKKIFKSIGQEDIQQGLDTAAKIGDDALQQRGGGDVNPAEFTHGTSAQRQAWFSRGYESGSPKDCDTFAARRAELRISDQDPHRTGLGGRLLQNRTARLRYVKEALRAQRRQRPQVRRGEDRLDRRTVAAGDQRAQAPYLRKEQAGRDAGAVRGGRLRLVVAAAREALLRPAARRGPALHVVGVDLGHDQLGALGDADRDRTLAGQQQPDPADRVRLAPQGLQVVDRRSTRRRHQLGGRAVRRGQQQAVPDPRPVPGGEVLQPARQPLGRDIHPPSTTRGRPRAHAAPLRRGSGDDTLAHVLTLRVR